MEVNAQNIQQLGVYLQQTLSPQNEVRKPAEEFLQSVEGNQNYPILLLNLLQSDGVDVTIKVKFHVFKIIIPNTNHGILLTQMKFCIDIVNNHSSSIRLRDPLLSKTT